MRQCELCGAMYDAEKNKAMPECPVCREFAALHPEFYKYISKVVEFAVARAIWAAGEDLYAHQRNKKHENNMHYQGFFS